MKSESEIIEMARELGAQKFVGLFSGGKDSLAVCHWMWKQGLMTDVLYCYTGVGLKENFNYVIETCNKFGWSLHVEFAQGRFTYAEFVRRYGFPGGGIHMGIMRWLKWMGIRRFNRAHLEEKVGFVSGTRKKESKRRMKLSEPARKVTEGERKNAPIIMFSPHFYWTTEQVFDYIKENNLELCPVYETMHMGGDCFCGAFAQPEETSLLKTFHPDFWDGVIQPLVDKYPGRPWGWENLTPRPKKRKETVQESLVCNECIFRS